MSSGSSDIDKAEDQVNLFVRFEMSGQAGRVGRRPNQLRLILLSRFLFLKQSYDFFCIVISLVWVRLRTYCDSFM